MKLKKFIAMAAVVGMVAGLATGCGGSNSDSSADSTGSDAKTEASADFDTSSDITIVSREDGSGTRGAFIELFGITVAEQAEICVVVVDMCQGHSIRYTGQSVASDGVHGL